MNDSLNIYSDLACASLKFKGSIITFGQNRNLVKNHIL